MKKKIIIIGAGIAGLTAARELQSEFDVMVLEASAQTGGRCRTAVRGAEKLEHGAAFLQGSVADNPFAALAAAHGLDWMPSETQRAIYSGGHKLSAKEQSAAEEFLVAIPNILQSTGDIIFKSNKIRTLERFPPPLAGGGQGEGEIRIPLT